MKKEVEMNATGESNEPRTVVVFDWTESQTLEVHECLIPDSTVCHKAPCVCIYQYRVYRDPKGDEAEARDVIHIPRYKLLALIATLKEFTP